MRHGSIYSVHNRGPPLAQSKNISEGKAPAFPSIPLGQN